MKYSVYMTTVCVRDTAAQNSVHITREY